MEIGWIAANGAAEVLGYYFGSDAHFDQPWRFPGAKLRSLAEMEDRVARLTKSEIEGILLSGHPVEWADPVGKRQSMQLSDPKQRRLFSYLLNSKVRQPTGLPETFLAGLQAAWEANDDPAVILAASTAPSGSSGPWRLRSIEAASFGGLNSWKGGPFKFDFDGDSFLLDGPNGSGKSSLIGAMIWALVGERPRDQSGADGHNPRPVYAASAKPAGEWPPIACYPPSVGDLKTSPEVRVKLTFVDPGGAEATVERHLSAGTVNLTVSPNFRAPSVLIETGLLMPARLGQLRFDDGGGTLTDAVQALTGLDDLTAIGALTDGLCHKTREYRGYRAKELAGLLETFNGELETARTHLRAVQIDIPAFKPADTEDASGVMAQLGKRLKDLAAEHASVVTNDIKSGLDLAQTKIQSEVIANIAIARKEVGAGLANLKTWAMVSDVAAALGSPEVSVLRAAVTQARSQLSEMLELKRKSEKDNRFQLKALGAKWHALHASGPIENCPLCELDLRDRTELTRELEKLRSAGEAATRTFEDNSNALLMHLENAVPPTLRKVGPDVLSLEPRTRLYNEVRQQFVEKPVYKDCLVKVASLVDGGLDGAPTATLPTAKLPSAPSEAPMASRALKQIAIAEQLIELASWFEQNSAAWTSWWDELSQNEKEKQAEGHAAEQEDSKERICSHLDRLSDALEKSGPYRNAAEAMRKAWKAGTSASEIQKEVGRRDEIAENLQPLKVLGALCESVARDAINGLSGRIATLLGEILIIEQLQYQKTILDRKEGLVVQAGFSQDLRIDATLVANSSWLRAVLWSFVFALRQEAVDHLGGDSFPFLTLDDPQATFDTFHRARWAHYIAGLQSGPSKLQVVIATYDEAFVDLIRADGVTGRQALLVAPGPGCDHVSILEGTMLDRAWDKADAEKTPQAGVEYLAKVRVYLEGLLKLMFRGEEADVRKKLLGDLRDLLHRMNLAGRAPWDAPVFGTLLGAITKTNSAIQYIEGSHHTTGSSYGMVEAKVVHDHWRKLGPILDRAFRTAREHRLLHGGMTALYPQPSTAVMPDGHQDAVASIPLNILGRAAALTDGRAADGFIDVTHFEAKDHVSIKLGKHSAYRLAARTLEPVARPGDILLTREYGDVSTKSLVVARHDDRLYARRFEVSANHSDVAALTAQAVNPREIAPPIVTHKGSLEIHKIVGVLFASSAFSPPAATPDEVCDCGGAAALTYLTKNALGLVQVDGQSAEPIALNKQYLIVKDPISPEDAERTLDGKPIIAEDSDGICYFKRLRIQDGGEVVLESLDSGGEYPPVTLARRGSGRTYLAKAWPVAGILFEIPS